MDEKTLPSLTQSVRRATGIRLTVFLPVLLVMLTVSVGFWAIYLAAGSLGLTHSTPRALVEIQAVRRTIFLVVGVGGGLALLLGLALAYSIRRPIRQLLRRAEAGAPVKRIDELADLAELTSALNQLLHSLETLSVKLEQVERQRHG